MGSLHHKTWHIIKVVFALMRYDPLKTRSHCVTTIASAINASNKLHYSLWGSSHDVAEWVAWISFNKRVHARNFCRSRCRNVWMGFSTNVGFSASFKLHSSRVNDKAPYAAVYRGVQFHLIQRSHSTKEFYVHNALFTVCVGVSLTVSNWLTQTKPDAMWCYDCVTFMIEFIFF